MNDELKSAFEKLKATREALHDANLDYLVEQRKFDIYKATAISNGVEGKNQAERDAKLTMEIGDAQSYLDIKVDARNKAQLNYDLAKIDVDLLKQQIRLLELEQPVNNCSD